MSNYTHAFQAVNIASPTSTNFCCCVLRCSTARPEVDFKIRLNDPGLKEHLPAKLRGKDSRMTKWLLLLGGVFQVAFGLFHILLSRSIHLDTTISTDHRALMQALNISGTIMIFFFAYVSLFCRHEMVTTHVGRATLAFVCMIYFGRAIESPLLFGFEPVIFTLCIIIGFLYLIPLLQSRRTSGEVAT
jgi:hypothetical protein